MSQLPRCGVVLANLGTPAAPTPTAVRHYLREFLGDSRVIEVPRPVWWVILNLFILPLRPRRVAKLYASIWQDGDSPMRHILRNQAKLLEESLRETLGAEVDVVVRPAMTYGQPSLSGVLDQMRAEGIEQIVVLPLFPQYSATSTAPVYDALQRWTRRQRNLPAITVIKDYFQHPGYIAALAASVREHWDVHGRADKLLFSFHGIPQPYADKGDPYPDRCRKTAALVAGALALREDQWAISFQSRFGLQEWVKPYTDVLLEEWGKAGIGSVQVSCPAFSADCLETLEEIAEENGENFRHAGGKRYEYIPALNARPEHIAMMHALAEPCVRALAGIAGAGE